MRGSVPLSLLALWALPTLRPPERVFGVLVNLDAIPAWAVALTEALGLGLFGITLWFIVKPPLRRRIPIALGVIAVLTLVQAEIQQRDWREGAWLVLVVGLAFALSAVGKRGGVFARYYEIEEKHGKKSKELYRYSWKIVARVTLILVVLLLLSAWLINGAYSQGT
jgi:hypothetical protein